MRTASTFDTRARIFNTSPVKHWLHPTHQLEAPCVARQIAATPAPSHASGEMGPWLRRQEGVQGEAWEWLAECAWMQLDVLGGSGAWQSAARIHHFCTCQHVARMMTEGSVKYVASRTAVWSE